MSIQEITTTKQMQGGITFCEKAICSLANPWYLDERGIANGF